MLGVYESRELSVQAHHAAVVDEMAEAYGMPRGVFVSQVYEGTGAEAAGIVKFRTSKEEAQRRLNHTENNLVRIEDILSEFSKSLSIQCQLSQMYEFGWPRKNSR